MRYLGAALIVAVGAVHLQHSAAIAVALLSPDPLLRRLAAAGGVALCIGALVSIVLLAGGGVFGYQEPDWRIPMVLAVISEGLAIPVLAVALLGARSPDRHGRAATA